MARRIRDAKLETRTARLNLLGKKRPYFTQIGLTPSGRHIRLGYRRNKKIAGSWLWTLSDGKGGKGPERSIGPADDFEGTDGLTFWEAAERARREAHLEPGAGGDSVATVAEALEEYQTELKHRGGDIANVARVKKHLPNQLAEISVAAVTVRDLRAWRDALLTTDLAPATVNRTTNALKAALNLAADKDDRITSRRAWRTGLAAIPDAEESRNVILPEAAVRRIIVAASEEGSEFGLLVAVAAVTGARVSQLARLEVQDLQDDRGDPRLMMPSSKKGRGQKKILRRPVPIPAGLAARLRAVASRRGANARLLLNPDGAPWGRTDHSRPFARTAQRAELDPTQVTIYALRHSNIVRQLLANVPVRIVAVNHDTSVTMIERTYSRHIGDHADALARKALLDVVVDEPATTMVPFPAAS